MNEHRLSAGWEEYISLLKGALTASIYDESGWVRIRSTVPALHSGKTAFRLVVLALLSVPARILQIASVILVWCRPFDPEKREQGADWPLFGYTMVGLRRLQNIEDCVKNVLDENVEGDFIETGAWRGGTCIFMRALLKAYEVTSRRVWVADSFEGLPKPRSRAEGMDLSNVDFLKVSLEQVKMNFRKFNLLDEQVQFLPGWFCDTLPQAPIERIAILRLDGDMYNSTMDALVNLYHKVSKGGYVIIDDYYSWPSCRSAVSDFLRERSLNPEILRIDSGAAYWKVS